VAEGRCALKSGLRVQAWVCCRVKGVGGVSAKRPEGLNWQRKAPSSSSPRDKGPC
jgi:hypothetical protein